LDGNVPSPDDDFHLDPQSSDFALLLTRGGTRPADLVFDPTFAC
jgi:hypothetical protein